MKDLIFLRRDLLEQVVTLLLKKQAETSKNEICKVFT